MSELLRVMIVDDEPLALDRLTDLLGRLPYIELTGAIGSGSAAIAAINELQPDLVFLDIEMPKVDGFDIVEVLARDTPSAGRPAPLVCFVTAYPQFASDAFETGALDFLCKPVRLKRLEKTIERARIALRQREAANRLAELTTRLDELRHTRTATQERSLWVQQRGEMIRIPIVALDWIQAEGEYVRLHLGEKSYLLRSSISSLVDDLANEGFLRIHRSLIINLERLSAIRGTRAGSKAKLSTGVELPVGRKYRRSLLEAAPKRL
jgi:DNA-binding LytR/AlgR family response regulator